jgi:hypothetical protein
MNAAELKRWPSNRTIRLANVLAGMWLLAVLLICADLIRDLFNAMPPAAIALRALPITLLLLLHAWGYARLMRGPSIWAVLASLPLTMIVSWGAIESISSAGLGWIEGIADILFLVTLGGFYTALGLYLTAARRGMFAHPSPLDQVFD